MKVIPDISDPFVFYSFWIFAGLVFLQIVYTILFFGRLAYFKQKAGNTNLPPVSVVIAARNESDNLFENLPKILDQNYPAPFEVVVVNHQSIDDSKYLLDALRRSYPQLVVMELEKSKHLLPSKKLPLTLGIKKAKYEHLILTDADCSPSSEFWLQRMAEQFTEQKQLVLGYGPYKTEPGFLNKVIRFDTTMIAIHYFSLALNRVPYMGVGRNMAYTKTLFDSVKGFKSHYAVASGDDDLFVQEAAKNRNYAIQLAPESYQFSDPKTTWETFFIQKARHYSTSPRYGFFKKAMLGIYPMTLLMLLVSFVILVSQSGWWIHACAGFSLVMLLKWWLLGRCFKRLKSKGFVALLPFLDLAYAVIMPFFYYSTLQKRTSSWK
ncbi:MAG: glycosyltransferase [Fluviicola sp.]|nr:glycosyltransferase [Fluviicola sp.]